MVLMKFMKPWMSHIYFKTSWRPRPLDMHHLKLSPDHFSLYLIQMHLVFIIGSYHLQDEYKFLNSGIFIKNTNDVLEQIIFRYAMKHKIMLVKSMSN